MDNFDHYQNIVIGRYCNGEFQSLLPRDVPDCGDGLLKFLLTELSENEGCDSIGEAIRRLDSAIGELTELRNSID
jgi:hypothetical protein